MKIGFVIYGSLDTLSGEMEKTRSGGQSDLMDTLIAYWWKDMFKPYDRDPTDIQWVEVK
jgi:hypothetical protein